MNFIADPTCPRRVAGFALTLGLLGSGVLLGAGVELTSPGLPPSQMDARGRLVEDWGALEVRLTGPGLPSPSPAEVNPVRLEDVVPAAEARWQVGAIRVSATVYRAPVWPGGLDVTQVVLEETSGQAVSVQLELRLPDGVRVGSRTASLGGRTVLALAEAPTLSQTRRDWGWLDDATALPGWARPVGDCDPAFRNIRAGLGGVPIHYRFKVEPRAGFNVVLGFCESHWSQSGQRPVVCQVEGAPTQEVDPLARWGQHRPGALVFAGKDENGDGILEVSVLPKIGAPDLNPILNVLWVFPPGPDLNLEAVIAGRMNGIALRYVDVGGEKDQSLLESGRVEYALALPAHGKRELIFLAACPGGSVPMPERTAWTAESLRRAAVRVWTEWKGQ